jgi:hypothetical protein
MIKLSVRKDMKSIKRYSLQKKSDDFPYLSSDEGAVFSLKTTWLGNLIVTDVLTMILTAKSLGIVTK